MAPDGPNPPMWQVTLGFGLLARDREYRVLAIRRSVRDQLADSGTSTARDRPSRLDDDANRSATGESTRTCAGRGRPLEGCSRRPAPRGTTRLTAGTTTSLVGLARLRRFRSCILSGAHGGQWGPSVTPRAGDGLSGRSTRLAGRSVAVAAPDEKLPAR
jgi:hypothetical protein